IDHGTSSAVLFGGTDTADLGRITSGASTRPVLARFHGRGIGMRELRLARDFFSLGPLRPGHPVAAPTSPGALCHVLEEEVGAEYFQPLPRTAQDPQGRYDLEFNGRFAAAMDFSHRPVDVVTLRTSMQATTRPEELELRWEFTGPATSLCLLLALDAAPTGPGLRRDAQGRHVLEPSAGDAEGPRSAHCHLRGAEESLEISAAGALGGRAFYDPGEAYTFLGASDEPAGEVLLIPASSDAPLTLRLRISPDPGRCARPPGTSSPGPPPKGTHHAPAPRRHRRPAPPRTARVPHPPRDARRARSRAALPAVRGPGRHHRG